MGSYSMLQIEEKDELIRKVALLRRNAMAAPFERAIDTHHQLATEASKFTAESAPETSNAEVMAIHYREEEAMYIQASHDRVTVIFSTVFREETDRIFGKVFLSEFVDARRRAIQNAPQVLYRNDPPLEIRNVPGVKMDESRDIGYITFGKVTCPALSCTKLICNSTLSTPSDPSTSRGVYIPYPDLQRLLPLPYQSR